MKNKLKIAAFYLLAVIIGGCVPSLHPLFTDDEIIFDANLLGKWAEPNSKNFWEFKPIANSKKYDFIYTDEKGKGLFEARLGKLGNSLFLDIYPDEPNVIGNDFYKAHLLGVHSFMKVELSNDGLILRIMNPENTDKLLKSEPNVVKHERVNDRTILTASTKELQAFILKYGLDEKLGLFGKAEENEPMHRIDQQESNEPQNKESNQP